MYNLIIKVNILLILPVNWLDFSSGVGASSSPYLKVTKFRLTFVYSCRPPCGRAAATPIEVPALIAGFSRWEASEGLHH